MSNSDGKHLIPSKKYYNQHFAVRLYSKRDVDRIPFLHIVHNIIADSKS